MATAMSLKVRAGRAPQEPFVAAQRLKGAAHDFEPEEDQPQGNQNLGAGRDPVIFGKEHLQAVGKIFSG